MSYLEGFLEQNPDKLDEEVKLHIMNAILKMDPVHEEVFKQKMDILIAREDRHGSQKCYDRFTCAWQLMFDEAYPMNFEEFNGA